MRPEYWSNKIRLLPCLGIHGKKGRLAPFWLLGPHTVVCAGAPLVATPCSSVLRFSTMASTTPRQCTHHLLEEPLVSGNLVNRFSTLYGPHARTPYPFHHLLAVSPNGGPRILRVCSREQLCRGVSPESEAHVLGRHGSGCASSSSSR